jgi:hypothetical protein
MSRDLNQYLKDWPYLPGVVSARWIEGVENKPKIQLRMDLGILQMEIDGRPDGTMPHGYPSLLEYYNALERQLDNQDQSLKLDAEACQTLQQEAMQYHYRYLAFAALHYPEGVIRDTQHNLDLFELADSYVDDDNLVWQFVQYFPYVRMMNARACADKAINAELYDEAMEAVEKGLEDIRMFVNEQVLDGRSTEETPEIQSLCEIRDQIRDLRPKTPEEHLKEQMDMAIRMENYEQAAQLRDALKRMR